ncbi:MAG: cell division protein FtsB, partial [Gammaproteobacteria bacterium]
MKFLIVILLIFIALLQNRLWQGDGGIAQTQQYQRQLQVLQKQLAVKQQRNEVLKAE